MKNIKFSAANKFSVVNIHLIVLFLFIVFYSIDSHASETAPPVISDITMANPERNDTTENAVISEDGLRIADASSFYPVSFIKKLEALDQKDSAWSGELKAQLDRLISAFENYSYVEADTALAKIANIKIPATSETKPILAELQVRQNLWKQLLDIQKSESASDSPNPVMLKDAADMYAQTQQVIRSFRDVPNSAEFLKFCKFDTFSRQLDSILKTHDSLLKQDEFFSSGVTISKVSLDSSMLNTRLSPEETRSLLSSINGIFLRCGEVSRMPEWTPFFSMLSFSEWTDTFKQWYGNLVDPLDYLTAYEQYLDVGNAGNEKNLSLLTRQMLHSQSESYRAMGTTVQNQFSQPHLKLCISEHVINRMLPPRDPEFDVVRDSIAGQQVYGRRRTETQVKMDLIPSPDRLLISLNINGVVRTSTTANSFPATVHNQSYANYIGRKQLELTAQGIKILPAEVVVPNAWVKLNNIHTDFDSVPLLGDIVRGIATSQYEEKRKTVELETRRKVLMQAKQQIDKEADERFAVLNDRMTGLFLNVLTSQGASLEQRDCRTTEEWLYGSWSLSTPAALGSHTGEPLTPETAVADLKIHQSGINAALERLELGGKRMTVRELKQYLLGIIGRSDLFAGEENDDAVMELAEHNPVSVRFLRNQVEVSLSVNYLGVEKREWYDFGIFVYYKPQTSAAGGLCLVRDGVVQLKGDLSFRTQIPLRAIFSKIFAPQGEIPLCPKLFREDERFLGITTGQLRIADGWFAVALVSQPVIAKNKGDRRH
ncbi:MAG: hypothetical protein LBQ54_13945 [Planctomycetaceae bacterium]|nr:hypothetical protein [Planctomycetaceae bacterium]